MPVVHAVLPDRRRNLTGGQQAAVNCQGCGKSRSQTAWARHTKQRAGQEHPKRPQGSWCYECFREHRPKKARSIPVGGDKGGESLLGCVPWRRSRPSVPDLDWGLVSISVCATWVASLALSETSPWSCMHGSSPGHTRDTKKGRMKRSVGTSKQDALSEWKALSADDRVTAREAILAHVAEQVKGSLVTQSPTRHRGPSPTTASDKERAHP